MTVVAMPGGGVLCWTKNATAPGFELQCEQWLPRPVHDVFAFFGDAYNLERITPDFLRFKVLRTTDRIVRSGTLIDYRLRLHGVPVRWRTRIDEWVPGIRFVDRQVKGPYKSWHHTHEFHPERGGTRMRDIVRYELPLGALGRLVAGAVVRHDVDEIFRHRQRQARAIFVDGTR